MIDPVLADDESARSSRAGRVLRPLGMLALFLVLSTVARGASLTDVAAGIRIDTSEISVSGISSGAYMAQQLHVAHSRHIKGAGLIAGGPFYCAGGSYPPYTWFDLTGLYAATSRCSNTNPWWFYQGPPDIGFSVRETRSQAAQGNIDPLQNLRAARVWLFSGGKDATVPSSVVDALERYYGEFVDADNIAHRRLDDAGHAMITDDFGSACDVSATPFINDCDFDAAGELLRHLYGALEPEADPATLRPVLEFDQGEHVDAGTSGASAHAVGHVYVPAACLDGDPCRLHVAFHGCRQQQELVGDGFYSKAGYNEWADTNRIVVLYPQVTASSGNPRGCWDWWGYSAADFHTRSGPQIRLLARMINTLVGQDLLSR